MQYWKIGSIITKLNSLKNQNQVDKLYGGIIGIYTISYVRLLRFLLPLNFVFCKTKMFKFLFILFIIKQLLDKY